MFSKLRLALSFVILIPVLLDSTKMDFEGAASLFLSNSTLQEIWGYHMPGMPEDAFQYLINQSACEAFIGTGSEWYSWDDASNTINTWILPFTGLLLQAPFDSNDPLGTFWVIMRWTGGCIASLSFILWNIRTTANCAAFVDKATNRDDFPHEYDEDEKGNKFQSEFSTIRDSFFLLGVMNQFTLNVKFNGASAEKLIKVALFSKDLCLRAADSNIVHVRQALARDTREARKRGTVQCFLSMLWFIFGLIISIQQAFGLLGQDAAAHDLALGLTMIWFPVLILCSTVDRNPAIPEATQRQLNTFLAVVRDALLRDAGRYRTGVLDMEEAPQIPRPRVDSFDTVVTGSVIKVPTNFLSSKDLNAATARAITTNTPTPSAGTTLGKSVSHELPPNWFHSHENDCPNDLRWIKDIADHVLDEADFFLEFAGQGRKLWHYGVAHPIIQGLKKDGIMDPSRGWLYDPDARAKLICSATLDRRDRLHSWDMREVWQLAMSVFVVWGSCMSAFVLSYFTPTVGFGCRALGYIVFCINCSGMLLAEMLIWWMTPHRRLDGNGDDSEDAQSRACRRWRFWGLWSIRIGEVANLIWLMYILFAQILGSYNTCRCKCSNYGVGGGYIDLRTVLDPSPKQALPYWIGGTAAGCTLMCMCFAFVAWEWVTQAHLSTENYENAMKGLRTTRRWKWYTKWLLPLQA